MPTDISERGLERLICAALTGSPCDAGGAGEAPAEGGAGWICGGAGDYDREHCLDLAQLAAFLRATQPAAAEALTLDADCPARGKFLARLQREIDKRGTVDVLRKGVKHGPRSIDLFFGAPSPGNSKAAALYAANRFSVTRQLRYSAAETGLALDLALFVNGLPIATFELKNSLTKQTAADAVDQYKRDRGPHEKLFRLGRCAAHFAVDEHEARFCTHLDGKKSWFLPFNRGWNDGAGNPPNPGGLKTDYLWRRTLTRESLTDIVENYAQLLDEKDDSGRKTRKQIWPRYHQLDVVRKLLEDVRRHGAGKRYLIQHSAGSGKSNSIAWLAHQAVGLLKDGKPVFDSVIVVTDRRVLDRQIRDTVKRTAQVGETVGHAERAGDLRKFLETEKKIVISTVQKFPFILDEMSSRSGRRFAVIIDEAHSSQGGKTSAAVSRALMEDEGEEETFEDKINRIIESRRLQPNVSYFAFTATPKNKTLELFGAKAPQPDGAVKHLPFHAYTMKQAVEEGFILDVLAHYTPVRSYYLLAKTIADDPEFDTKKAQKKLRRYVEGHGHAIRQKAEIMADHFHERVAAAGKIGGQARAMVVTDGVDRAISYYRALSAYLLERKSPHRAIVAFSGEREHDGARVSEASLNGFPSSQIADKIRWDPYRFLVCADKFQTGYDEPLLHTMYVDKTLSGVKAVQTLSRLNRARQKKYDVFALDFMNDADTIREAFEPYYRSTILADETDPDKLHDLKAALDDSGVYEQAQVEELTRRWLADEPRGNLDSILDRCVAAYLAELDEDGQVRFKGKAKSFIRTYGFLAMLLTYGSKEWEKLSIFLNFLTPKLPAPREEDLSRGILEAIDMDSYRVEKQAAMDIGLPDMDGEIDPVPVSEGGGKADPELEMLSDILREFNERFGSIDWKDADRVRRLITEDIPARVKADAAYGNARRHSDRQNARVEHDRALKRAMNAILSDDTQLFKQFADNEDFKRWLTDMVFRKTYRQPPSEEPGEREERAA